MIFLVENLLCDMDVAGIKHTRFGLLYTLLHQNEIVEGYNKSSVPKRGTRPVFDSGHHL